MHFALPPRKTSGPPPYARVSAKHASDQRRKQIQLFSSLVFGVLTIYLLYSFFASDGVPNPNAPIPKDSSVVIVTVLDEPSMSDEYMAIIRENRDDYARRHGYKTFYTNTSTYAHLTKPSPASWAVIPALRHALTNYPEVDYVWSLTPHALIMNPGLSLHDHIFSNLTSLMQKDIPVVPPDSVIHTFSHLKASQAYLIITQDVQNVAHTSFLLRNTASIPVPAGQPRDAWAHYFLDAWFDPLYRAYAFQKAENHALEHIIQWHPTLLAKLVMVKQRLLNSYNHQASKTPEEATWGPTRTHDGEYQPGDLVVNFIGCHDNKERDCEKEIKNRYHEWQNAVARQDGKATST